MNDIAIKPYKSYKMDEDANFLNDYVQNWIESK